MNGVDLALECGATKAENISREQIVTSAFFREICEGNGCGFYNRCYMCPPDVGDIHVLMAKLREYPRGILYQTIHKLEDSYDYEGMMAGKDIHAECAYRFNKALKPDWEGKMLHLSIGGCKFCKTCAKVDNEPCRFPNDALPSLESYGIDVYKTAAATDLKYMNGADTVTYFGLVMFEDEVNA